MKVFSISGRLRQFSALLAALLPLTPSLAEESYDCLIEPMVVIQLGSPVQGIVSELEVDRSDSVSAGQPVASLKSTVERASVDQAEARARMAGEIAARRADLDLARHHSQRMKTLHARKMVSSHQRDEVTAQLHVAEAALKQAEDNYLLMQHDLTRSKAMLEQRTIRSPIDGVVVERHTFPGEFVYDNPIMTIAQLDPLRIEVVLPAEQFGQYRPGDKAVVYPELTPDEPVEVTVDVVDRLLDTFSGTFGVRLVLNNPNLTIAGGQKCRLVINQKRISVSGDTQ